jgi:uncharacterized protein (DUF362 family)
LAYKVAIVDANCDDDVPTAVFSAIGLVDGFRPREGSTIVIKPNLCSARKPPESGATTRVCVVESVINYINAQNLNCKIVIVEGDSDRSADEAFRRLGYADLEKKYSNVRLVNLSKDKTVKIVPEKSKKLVTIEIPETLLFMDYFISIANLKCHVNERITCIWKNQWGCLPYKPVRMRLHPFLKEALFDINTLFWADLCIVDGIIGLAGPGPIEGTPVHVGKILCSKDPLATDVVAARIIGVSPKKVPHLKYALKQLHRKPESVFTVGCENKTINFKFITRRQYLLYGLSFRVRKLSEYVANVGFVFSLSAYALRSIGFSELTRGKMFSLKKMFKIVKDLLFKVEAAERAFG